MNDKELHGKVHSAMYTLIKKNGVASPVEVLIEIGVLSKENYENWRRGYVPYLERVCQINLSKLATINHEIRVFARKNNLKPSWSDYRKWGKGNRIRLLFSKAAMRISKSCMPRIMSVNIRSTKPKTGTNFKSARMSWRGLSHRAA